MRRGCSLVVEVAVLAELFSLARFGRGTSPPGKVVLLYFQMIARCAAQPSAANLQARGQGWLEVPGDASSEACAGV